MSTWHYQLIKHIYPKGEVYYSVHEYYPATENRGEAWTLSPVALSGVDPDDIQWLMVQVLNCLGKHKMIEVEHDDYGVVYAEINGVNPCPMCGGDRNE